MLNGDQLAEYLRLTCHTDVFWLDTVGRIGLHLPIAAVLEDRRVRRLRVDRSGVVAWTVHSGDVQLGMLPALPGHIETRAVASPVLEAQLTNDDFLVVDDQAAVRLVFDDHNRFVYAAHVGRNLLNRYRFIQGIWWPTAKRQ
jgi:hypothetical protein